MMKRTYRNRMAIALLSATGLLALAACDKDSDSLLPGTPVESLTIDTHVNGYVPEGAAAGTRASTSGNTFKFTTGDAIGLIALKNGSVMSQYNNVKLTYNGGGSWKSSTDIYDFGGMSFIAYYPYRSDMAGKTSVDAIKSAFPIQDNQSTEAKFNASNLMTSQTTASNGTLKFNFTPAFAMVEVSVPEKIRGYSNGSGENFTYDIYGIGNTIPVPSEPTFYKTDERTYRRIVRASANIDIKIKFNSNSKTVLSYSKTMNISAGNYKKMVLKGTINKNLGKGTYAYRYKDRLAFHTDIIKESDCFGVVFLCNSTLKYIVAKTDAEKGDHNAYYFQGGKKYNLINPTPYPIVVSSSIKEYGWNSLLTTNTSDDQPDIWAIYKNNQVDDQLKALATAGGGNVSTYCIGRNASGVVKYYRCAQILLNDNSGVYENSSFNCVTKNQYEKHDCRYFCSFGTAY